ncbi:UDP-glucose 4-epimerase [Algoriphagus boseongensis]|uniref:UDP-glucose 4-epimerase n=1 Tax=Algoriphagus boseongensis TaxID=1442587 RepID=A0A4R6TD42_9BACT|nr:NAD-dependent epimerase/dehydratase family protein [Algoriphagus boseongensis]TDQ19374.1 UDP-glucose 4-epimerase [Algoriphagus boseongensis]
MKHILVLGSEGFIGRHVVTAAIQQGHHVYGVDIADKMPAAYNYEKLSLLSADIDLFLSAHPFDIIINCAGSGNVGFSVQHPLTDFDLNTRSVVFILEAVRKHQPAATYVHVSSAAVYGNPHTLPVTETAQLQPVSPYGYHKWMSEMVCREYAALYGLRSAIARPFSVYGPGLQKQLLWDLFQKASRQQEIVLWGTGEETRDFIFVEDAANALLRMGTLETGTSTVYNLAYGQPVTVRHAAGLLMESLGWNRTIHFNGEVKEGDPRFWQADISAIRAIGFEPSVSLVEGFKLTAAWLLSLKESQ